MDGQRVHRQGGLRHGTGAMRCPTSSAGAGCATPVDRPARGQAQDGV